MGFKLENIPRNALKELISLIESAEDKFKIALIDLLRLLIVHEQTAAIVTNEFWHSLDTCIFEYIKCLDIKNLEEKTTQNYHLVCLKMLANIYQSQ